MSIRVDAEPTLDADCDGCGADIFEGESVYCARCMGKIPTPGQTSPLDRVCTQIRWLADDLREAGADLRFVGRLREIEDQLWGQP